MAFGNPEESASKKKARLYKQYYEAGRCSDEYAAMRQSEIRRQIEEIDESDSWGHTS